MKRLKKLIDKSKCGVIITVNEHRNYYETIEENVSDDDRKEIDIDIWNKMIEMDTCVRLQFYPDTPIGFYLIHHYDVEKAIDLALDIEY